MVLFPLRHGGGISSQIKNGSCSGSLLISARGISRTEAVVLLDLLQINRCTNIKKMTISAEDKGYDPDKLRLEMFEMGYIPIIGYRNNRKDKVETA